MNRLFTLLLMAVAALAASAEGSFSVSGRKILDAGGNEFMMRGVNYSWCWQRGHEYSVIPAAKRIGANIIRIQLGDGQQFYRPSASELEELIALCEQHRLVAMFNTHDETGSDNVDDLRRAAAFWIDMKDVLNRHLSTVIVNISNEWYGSWGNADAWADGYKTVIPMMRQAGLRNMLVVDCAGYGQWPRSMFLKGDEVARADELHNTVLSMHLYQDAAGTDRDVRSHIDNAQSLSVPVIIGEFAYRHKGCDVAWQTILDYSLEKRMGWLGWSWTGNGGGAEECDMFASYDDSQYLPNGTCIVKGRGGIAETSEECLVFSEPLPGPDGPDPEPIPGPDGWDVAGEHVLSPAGNPAGWNNVIEIPATVFASATRASMVRLHADCDGGAEIQLAVKTADESADWTQLNDYDRIDGPTYDLAVEDVPRLSEGMHPDTFLERAKARGLYVKGRGFRLNRVQLLNPRTDDLTVIASDIADDTEPAIIHDLQGRRVEHMQPGGIYIVRRGARVTKVVR